MKTADQCIIYVHPLFVLFKYCKKAWEMTTLCCIAALSQGDDNFVLCPQQALDWDHRKFHIIEEMLLYDPTLVCLEEVDQFQYIKDMMSKAGYDGCFFPKPDSPCLYSEVNYGPDGCSVFWKSDQLKLLQQTDIVLEREDGQKSNQVAILCKFTYLATQKEFFVAVTHLKSKTPYWQLRHEQGKFLEKVLSANVTESSPLVVCGDFNAEPSEQVYAVFQSSKLGLCSAYCQLSDKLEEPQYTTWKIRGGPKGNKEAVQCIDYVWYTSKHLQPVALLKFPSGEEIGKDRLPSLTYPSDHLSLVVDFAILEWDGCNCLLAEALLFRCFFFVPVSVSVFPCLFWPLVFFMSLWGRTPSPTLPCIYMHACLFVCLLITILQNCISLGKEQGVQSAEMTEDSEIYMNSPSESWCSSISTGMQEQKGECC